MLGRLDRLLEELLFFWCHLLHQEVEHICSAILLQIAELLAEMDHFVDFVERRVVESLVSVDIFFIGEIPFIIVFVRLDVYPDVVLILNDLSWSFLLDFGHLFFFVLFCIPYLNAFAA